MVNESILPPVAEGESAVMQQSSSSQLSTLNQARKIVKGKITRIGTWVASLESLEDVTLDDLEVRLGHLIKGYSDFESVQTQIESITNDPAASELQRSRMEEQFYFLESTLKKFIRSLTTPVPPIISQPRSDDGQASLSSHGTHYQPPPASSLPDIRLPAITLPTFDGRSDEFQSFTELFHSIINDSPHLSKVAQFYYLRSSLKGAAANVIRNIPATAENYEVAWSLLNERYLCTGSTVDRLNQELLNLSPVHNDHPAALRVLVDNALRIVRSLKALNTIQETKDSIFVTIITSKLDIETKKAFRMSLPNVNYIATLSDLQSFLSKRLQVLESLQGKKERSVATHQSLIQSPPNQRNYQGHTRHSPSHSSRPAHHPQNSYAASCLLCKNHNHKLAQCQQYKEMSTDDRIRAIQNVSACYNCLGSGHALSSCPSKLACLHCKRRHHTSIHRHHPTADTPSREEPSTSTQPNATVSLFYKDVEPSSVLLSTAVIIIHDVSGKPFQARALLDTGSQGNLMSSELASKLRLPTITSHQRITGVGNSNTAASKRVHARIFSRVSRFAQNAEFLVLPVITSVLPVATVDKTDWNIPSHFQLADEDFDLPAPIDILLGAHIFYKILSRGKLHSNGYRPTLINTQLGWILGGEMPRSRTINSTHCHLSLSEQVENLWRLDECQPAPKYTPEEISCEQHFLKTHNRTPEGRFVIQLPFRKDPTELGHSKNQARRRWYAVEARLNRDRALRDEYQRFMKEYLSLHHMSLVGPDAQVPELPGHYYLPHHPVHKLDSTTTKTRVVFDGSMKSSNGLSLNNILMVGPTIQSELFHILLRFRLHQFVFMADIEKMYRQILVHPTDRVHQRILWREQPTGPLYVYELKTITYGTGPAPYLATRCLKQLAENNTITFPLASRATLRDFYVDDFLSGHDTIEGALALQHQIIDMLSQAGLPIRKWAANHPKLLENISESDREKLFPLSITADAVKTLGLIWIPSVDLFQYTVSKIFSKPATTKRQVLSQLASLYDPLGILGPIICTAKIFVQNLWETKLDWDETLPTQLYEEWSQFSRSLENLSNIKVPRHAAGKEACTYYLHGFSDASEKAYGCAIYLKSVDQGNNVSVKLLCARSRIAPTKQVTLPRLELSAALLLARLMTTVVNALHIPRIRSYCWSDSKIALAWIASPSYHWKTFVANRVSEIRDLDTTWNYIPSDQNPADLISRGCSVDELQNNALWWQGPNIILVNNHPNLMNLLDITEVPETKRVKKMVAHTIMPSEGYIDKFSSLHKLISVTAWILRFWHNVHPAVTHVSGPLSLEERDNALSVLLRQVQAAAFSNEILDLNEKGQVSKKSKLCQLAPYIDNFNLLRVGGRLKNTTLSYARKHPIILPPHHSITRLIIIQAHLQCLHGGPQLVLSYIQQKFWIINGKKMVRKILHQCIPCFRNKPVNTAPMMGQLPTTRTEPVRPFYHTGVDFAGPFLVKPPTRSNIKLKYYVAVFICMATKAVHLELVGALTTESFIATLNRFTSRRGPCRTLSCDNATNFVGAKNKLREVYSFLKKHSCELTSNLSQRNIQFKFIPPLSPHWGGIWESAVKSMKRHLKRVAGLALLNYEEFLTILCSIEACLNSRPLLPLSTDPGDLEALTPGHFLIGAPLLAIPEIDNIATPISRLVRWHRIEAISQHFWRRWSREYVTSLIPLSKWSEKTPQLTIGKLVLLREDNLPPLQWKLGRITEIHPGLDNITRVVSVKTNSGIVTRTAHRVYPLPEQ